MHGSGVQSQDTIMSTNVAKNFEDLAVLLDHGIISSCSSVFLLPSLRLDVKLP
jgi:hypothetical protein